MFSEGKNGCKELHYYSKKYRKDPHGYSTRKKGRRSAKTKSNEIPLERGDPQVNRDFAEVELRKAHSHENMQRNVGRVV